MQIKRNLDMMQGTKTLHMFGGGASSDVWCAIMADVTGNVVRVPATVETACAGAAMLAGMACGIYENEADAASRVSISRTYEPDSRRFPYYKDKYSEYQRIGQRLWGLGQDKQKG